MTNSLDETIASLDGNDTQELTPLEIYNTLLVKNELLLTILPEQEAALRTGLIQVKAKENMRLKEKELPVDTSVLSFQTYPSKELEGAIVVHVSLAKRRTIHVLSITEPSGDF